MYAKKRTSIKVIGLLGIVALFPLARTARGSEWKLLDLDEVSAEYNHYLQPTHSAYFNESEKDGLSVNVDSTVAKYLFWNSTVHGTSNNSQYRLIGLYMQVGARVSRYVDLSVWHHSQHLLDGGDEYGRHFPVENAVELKVYFYRRERREALIP